MRLIKEFFTDIPLCLFKYEYGISIDDALDWCHEKGKMLLPILGRRTVVSTGMGSVGLIEKQEEFYLFFISDIMIKNESIVSLKQEVIGVS